MKKLSIVVPCYNCSQTIERLLNSILHQNLNKTDYEVIICDDKSTDNFLKLVKPYENQMDIVYTETTRDFHCPGNTRQAAIPFISGEWFTFIDNDDMFEENVFQTVLNEINSLQVKYVLCTNFRSYNVEQNKYIQDFTGENTDTWLHGKFFNKQRVIDELQCHFKENEFSHEDLYFNAYLLAKLVNLNEDYIYSSIFTYKWVANPQSLSRSYFNEKHYYIETYLEDYLISGSEAFFELYKQNKNNFDKSNFALNQIIMTLLHGYFYYQASLWRLGPNEVLPNNYNALKTLKQKLWSELKVSDETIIQYVYQNPLRYHSIKEKCFNGSGFFVEVQSFRDFILNL